MSFVWAVIALVGVVCLLNLSLTVGVIRRLREHTTLLERALAQSGGPGEVTHSAGTQVDGFRVVTGDDRVLTRDDLRPGTLVAFFSPHCPACEEQKPAFLRYVSSRPGGRDDVVAVLLGAPEEIAGLREELAGVAQLVVEADLDGPMAKAFGLRGYPAFCLMGEEGVIAVTGFRVEVLPDLVTP